MVRIAATVLGFASFAVAYLAAVWADVPPLVRLGRASVALVVGLVVGALCGVILRRIVLHELRERWPESAEAER